ncbi:MAG: xylose isomerase [Planctomycetaceae bacterium]|nr:xylose isomerase [Planctomycetaceae bacterium]MBP63175.1 xylose isomerase [Planctomycetaceae bacterium]
MLVSASTGCFAELPLAEVLDRLVDLEFTNVEIDIHESGRHLKPSEVARDLEKAIDICRKTNRLNVVSYSVEIETSGEEHYDQFKACCQLAKATKVVSITVPSAEIGTPFNEEVEHLRRLVSFASAEGILVSMKSQIDRLSQDPNTVVVLCDNAPGLGLTLDPSHYVYTSTADRNYDQVMKYVYHVHLRDTSRDELQVRVGRGDIEYGRLVNQLNKHNYRGALSVHITEMPDVDHFAELRKMRLLLESLR